MLSIDDSNLLEMVADADELRPQPTASLDEKMEAAIIVATTHAQSRSSSIERH